MMRLPEFRYVAAKTTAEAVRLLQESGDNTRLVAGGTDLWPNMKRRHQQATTVVGLRGVRELHGIRNTSGGEVRVGAMTTLADVCASALLRTNYPGFVRAVASISSPVLRNMGTIGGNLCLDTRCTYYNQNEEWRQAIGYCMKEAGTTCWVATKSARCWAISASDSAPLLCAIGARVRLVSARGERIMPVTQLYREDGIEYLTMQRDEVLAEILLPPAGTLRSTYWKLRRRGSIDFPVLGVGAAVWLDGRRVRQAQLFLGAVVSAPTAVPAACDLLRDKELTPDVIAAAAALCRDVATPLDNTDFELAWRKQMVEAYVDGALRELAGLPPKAQPPRDGLWALSN